MVGRQTLNLSIGVRVPVPQPNCVIHYLKARNSLFLAYFFAILIKD